MAASARSRKPGRSATGRRRTSGGRGWIPMPHAPFSRAWMLPPGGGIQIPSGEAGRQFLATLDVTVPPRLCGRENWHRERYCIVALLRHLVQHRPGLFPASLERRSMPDFVLRPAAASNVIGIEHTDASSGAIQRKLDEGVWSESWPGRKPIALGTWIGDAAERQLQQDILAAVRRKAAKTWCDAPPGAEHWLLLYESIDNGLFVSDCDATGILQTALTRSVEESGHLDAIALVRDDPDRVLFVSSKPAGASS